MNKKEALEILQREMSKCRGLSWAKAQSFIGIEKVDKVTNSIGTEYYFELCVSYVDERELDIEVEGLVSEVKGRKLFPSYVQESYCISNPEIGNEMNIQ